MKGLRKRDEMMRQAAMAHDVRRCPNKLIWILHLRLPYTSYPTRAPLLFSCPEQLNRLQRQRQLQLQGQRQRQ